MAARICGLNTRGVHWHEVVYVAKEDKVVDIFLPSNGQAAKPAQAAASNVRCDTRTEAWREGRMRSLMPRSLVPASSL